MKIATPEPNSHAALGSQRVWGALVSEYAPPHFWGGRRGLNPRPPGPQPGALANLATPTMGTPVCHV